MNLEDELTNALTDGYRRAGNEVGYWGLRFLKTLRRKRGSRQQCDARAKRAKRAGGRDAMLQANRPDLTLEAIVLRDQFRSLFTAGELRVAEERF